MKSNKTTIGKDNKTSDTSARLPKKIAPAERLKVVSYKSFKEIKAKTVAIVEKWTTTETKESLEQQAFRSFKPGSFEQITGKTTVRLDKDTEVKLGGQQLKDVRLDEVDLNERLQLVASALTEMERIHGERTESEERFRQQLISELEEYKSNQEKVITALEEKKRHLNDRIESELNGNSQSKMKPEDKLRLVQEHQEVSDKIRDVMDESEAGFIKYKRTLDELNQTFEERRQADLADIHKYEILKKNLEKELINRKAIKKALEKSYSQFTEATSSDIEATPTETEAFNRIVSAAYSEMDQLPGPILVANKSSLFIKQGYIITEDIVKIQQCSTIYKARKYSEDGFCYQVLAVVLIAVNNKTDNVGHNIEDGIKLLRYLTKHAFIHIINIDEVYRLDNSIIIGTESLKMDIRGLVIKEGQQNEESARSLGKQIVQAIHFLHRLGIAHGNINAENIYISTTQHARLGGLEHCSRCWDTKAGRVILKSPDSTMRGTYFAPEICGDTDYDPTKADVYSFCMVICYTLLGYYPYDPDRLETEDDQWASAGIALKNKVSDDGLHVILQTSMTDPEERMTIWYLMNLVRKY